jgi:hypothetical protein
MPSYFLRLLVLASSLPLTLHSSWGCMVACPRATLPAGQATTCQCDRCPVRGDPSPKPAPQKGQCPCVEPEATAPQNLKTGTSFLALSVALIGGAPYPFGLGSPEIAKSETATSRPPLNILHCVWLC